MEILPASLIAFQTLNSWLPSWTIASDSGVKVTLSEFDDLYSTIDRLASLSSAALISACGIVGKSSLVWRVSLVSRRSRMSCVRLRFCVSSGTGTGPRVPGMLAVVVEQFTVQRCQTWGRDESNVESKLEVRGRARPAIGCRATSHLDFRVPLDFCVQTLRFGHNKLGVDTLGKMLYIDLRSDTCSSFSVYCIRIALLSLTTDPARYTGSKAYHLLTFETSKCRCAHTKEAAGYRGSAVLRMTDVMRQKLLFLHSNVLVQDLRLNFEPTALDPAAEPVTTSRWYCQSRFCNGIKSSGL